VFAYVNTGRVNFMYKFILVFNPDHVL